MEKEASTTPLNKNKIKAVIFDLDDTLYPEEEFVKSGFFSVSEYLAQKYKLYKKKIFQILKREFEKGVRGKNFNLLLENLNLPKKELKKLISIYRHHRPKIRLFPDAKKILIYLKKKKIKLGLITDGPVSMQRNKINALKIKKYFNVITFSDKFGKKFRKPNTLPFKITLQKLKTTPKEVVYIADNPKKDFIGARKLKILTFLVERPSSLYKFVKINSKNKPDFLIKNLLELKKYV